MIIEPTVRDEVGRRLDAIEKTYGVRIVYACESGSRAWGFASQDSDYDVRFLYVRDPDWYLSIDVERRRDVIETPIEGLWDINGWDVRKALQLMRKSNPPLMEWLQSPIVYRKDEAVVRLLHKAMPLCFSSRSAMYHYWHMARSTFRSHLCRERVRTKKYFYVLRPLLACRWLERNEGVVPMEFGVLLKATVSDPALIAAVNALLVAKRRGLESSEGPRLPLIHDFCASELARLEAKGRLGRPRDGLAPDAINGVFREVLERVASAA